MLFTAVSQTIQTTALQNSDLYYTIYQEASMEPNTTVPPLHQQAVNTIAEMFHLSPELAHTCLRNANYNKERAIEKLINPDFAEINPYSHLANFSRYAGGSNRVVDLAQEQDVEFISPVRPNRRTQFHEGGLRRNAFDQFKKTYIIKKKEKPKRPTNYRRKTRGKATPESAETKENIQQQFVFVEQLKKLLQKECAINFGKDLSEVFKEMYDSKKLVALHSLKFSQKQNKESGELQVLLQYIKNLYAMPQLAQSMNKAFINYGLDPSKLDYSHYPFMANFVNSFDEFMIVVLRYNQKLNTVEVFRKLRITQFFKLTEHDQFKITVNHIVSMSNRIAYNDSMGTKTLTAQEKRKIEEDRLIRQLQEKEYLQNMKFQQSLMKQEQQQLKQQQQKKETNQELKIKTRQTIIKYTPENIVNPITFKIRLPNGSSILLLLPKQQKINYIFNYVFCLDQQQAGFEDPNTMNFQIFQPYEKIYLSGRKDEVIGSVFEGSDNQTLIVKEN